MPATRPQRQETSTHSTCKVSEFALRASSFILLDWKVQPDWEIRLNVSHSNIVKNWQEYSFIAIIVVKLVPHIVLMEVHMKLGAVAVC